MEEVNKHANFWQLPNHAINPPMPFHVSPPGTQRSPLFAGKSLESGVFLKSFPPPVIRKNIFDRKIWRVSRLQRFFVRGGRERKRKRREFPPSPLMKRFVRGATDARQEEGIRDNFDERERLKLGNERSSGGQPV